MPDETKLKEVGEKLGVKEDLHTDFSVLKEVIAQLTKHGLNMGLEKFEIPKQVTLLTDQWTPESGLVTAAMKLKRKDIDVRYQAQIDAMYNNNNNNKKLADFKLNNKVVPV